MDPIVLTTYGETLLEYPYTVGTDADLLSTCVGMHQVCRGWIDIVAASDRYNALVCRSCKMRVLILIRVKTYGDLRNYFKGLQPVRMTKTEVEQLIAGPPLKEEDDG